MDRVINLIPAATRHFATLDEYTSYWKEVLPVRYIREYNLAARKTFVDYLECQFGILDSRDVQVAFDITCRLLLQEVDGQFIRDTRSRG